MSLPNFDNAYNLEPDHRRQLVEGSANAADVIAERVVRTVERGRELPPGYSWRQRRRGRGMLFTVHRPGGETTWCYRPDAPDPANPGRKYEMPSKHYGGPGNVLDVHPGLRRLIADTSARVIFVEGIKKADAITSAARAAGVEVLVVAISGVWNWLSAGEPIPDMFEIPVEGREVYVWFDSDMLRNPGVQDAARRLAEHLIGRGAEVRIVYMHDAPDGSKVGADDHFVAGGTLDGGLALSRPYDPADFARVRLERDDLMRALVEDLERRRKALPARTMAECSLRDFYLVCKEEAARSGEVHPDGLRIRMSQGTGSIRGVMSSRTFYKCQVRAEEAGLGYRDNADRKPGQAGAFVLVASVSKVRGSGDGEGTGDTLSRRSHAPYLHPRPPLLRWSDPGCKEKFEPVPGTARVRLARAARDAIERPGKRRGAALDVIHADGAGVATLARVAEVLGVAEPADLVCRAEAEGERDGPLVMLIDDGIIAVDGDLVRYANGWRERLEGVRERGREIEAEKNDRARWSIRRREYRTRRARDNGTFRASAPSRASLDAIERSRQKRDAEMLARVRPVSELEPAPPADPELIGALAAYLDRHPGEHPDRHPPEDRRMRTSMLASDLWRFELVEGKPAPAAVEVALLELATEAAA